MPMREDQHACTKLPWSVSSGSIWPSCAMMFGLQSAKCQALVKR